MNAFERMFTYKNTNLGDQTYISMVRTILENLDTVATGTIYDIADLCYTSATSISRLCKHLGYKGYSDFKASVLDVYHHYDFSNTIYNENIADDTCLIRDSFSDVLSMEAQWFKELDPVLIDSLLEKIHDCKSLYCFNYVCDLEQMLSLEMNLTMSGKQFYSWSDEKQFENAVKSMSPDILSVFMIPNIVQASYMWEYVKKAVEMHSPVVLIVQAKMNRDPKSVDLVIRYPGYGSSLDMTFLNAFWKMISFMYKKRYLQ